MVFDRVRFETPVYEQEYKGYFSLKCITDWIKNEVVCLNNRVSADALYDLGDDNLDDAKSEATGLTKSATEVSAKKQQEPDVDSAIDDGGKANNRILEIKISDYMSSSSVLINCERLVNVGFLNIKNDVSH